MLSFRGNAKPPASGYPLGTLKRTNQIDGLQMKTSSYITPSVRIFYSLALLLATFITSTTAWANTPASPTNVRVSVYSDTTAEVFWNRVNDPDGIQSYRIYSEGNLLRQVGGPSLYLEGLNLSREYTFQVTAVDSLGNESARGNVYAFSTRNGLSVISGNTASAAAASPTTTSPSTASSNSGASAASGSGANNIGTSRVPANLRVTSSTSTSATVSWQGPAGFGANPGYNVYLNNQYVTTVFESSYTVNGLNPRVSNDLYVIAFDGNGNFSPRSSELALSSTGNNPAPAATTTASSNSASSSAASVSGAPVAPTGLRVQSATSSSATISWSSAGNSSSTGYNVYVNNSYADTVFATSYTLNNLSSNRSSSLYLIAFDGNNNFSARSAELSVSANGTSSAANNNSQAAAPVQQAPVQQAPVTSSPAAVISPTIPISDLFGRALEVDNETPVPGGPPTRPKNLRADLIGNNWAELNWAPSRDDGSVVAYRIYRSDGVTYDVSANATAGGSGTARTLTNFAQTTTFVDCNFTHIASCDAQGQTPQVGSFHRYQVSAIDNNGNESGRSNALAIQFHPENGGPVARFTDPYLASNDNFLFTANLSNPASFLNQFDLVFSDEFNGNSIDPNKWTTSLTFSQENQNIINGEMQYFVDTQAQPDFGYDPFVFTGSTLKISAIPTPPELRGRALGQPFLSGSLSSHELRAGQRDQNGNVITDKFAATYGYVEASIKVEQTSGALNSFYLFRRWEGEHSPEIDILEYLGENPFGDEKAFQTYHYKDVTHGNILSSPTMFYPRESGSLGSRKNLNGFHTYSVLWEPSLVIWYIDGQEVQRLTGPQVSRQDMNIIFYLVTGSEWAPTPNANGPFPMEMEIDYVRAYFF